VRALYFTQWRPPTVSSDANANLTRIRTNLATLLRGRDMNGSQNLLRRLGEAIEKVAATDPAAAVALVLRLPYFAEPLLQGAGRALNRCRLPGPIYSQGPGLPKSVAPRYHLLPPPEPTLSQAMRRWPAICFLILGAAIGTSGSVRGQRPTPGGISAGTSHGQCRRDSNRTKARWANAERGKQCRCAQRSAQPRDVHLV
jgi:hypothetical protein